MTEIPEVAPKVKCGFCGKVMHVDEWSTADGKGGHQYIHGGDKHCAFALDIIVKRKFKSTEVE